MLLIGEEIPANCSAVYPSSRMSSVLAPALRSIDTTSCGTWYCDKLCILVSVDTCDCGMVSQC